MRQVEKSLSEWKASLCDSLDIKSLYSRNKIAHKWKATFRSLELREIISWRTQDLLEQSLFLFDNGHLLGARILLRSAFESIAVLIYLNQLTRSVLEGKLGFHVFSEKTASLLLGSRNESTPYKSLNIITILEKCDRRYPGILKLYGALSESSHPNYEGICIGYADIDREKYVVTFSNKWELMHSSSHINHIELCIKTFFEEYNNEWKDAFEKLETWLEKNDAELEATKKGA
jgi:hypothetical protein